MAPLYYKSATEFKISLIIQCNLFKILCIIWYNFARAQIIIWRVC